MTNNQRLLIFESSKISFFLYPLQFNCGGFKVRIRKTERLKDRQRYTGRDAVRDIERLAERQSGRFVLKIYQETMKENIH